MCAMTLDASRRAGILAALFVIVPLGAGCGDEPSDRSPPDAPEARVCYPTTLPGYEDIVPDGVHILFPPPGSLTHAATITVRGTAQLAAGVTNIRVNGVPAQTANEFRRWRVTVPLQPGANTLAVEVEDGDGQVDATAAQAEVMLASAPMYAAAAVALDATRDRALVIDAYRNGLFTVDLATGNRTLVYQPGSTNAGVGAAARPHLIPPLPSASSLVDVAVLGTEGQQALVVAQGGLASVELATGKARVISDGDTGSGPALVQLVDAALDVERARALVLDASPGALLAVDLTTGARAVISDDATGSGPALRQAKALALDAAGGRAFVVMGVSESSALLAVNVTTGARAIISSLARGTGPALGNPQDLALDLAGNRALVTDRVLGGLVAVDLDTGDRAVLSSAEAASGPGLALPAGVALDAQQGRALLVEQARNDLLAVDLATGARTLLSGDTVGSGYELRTPTALTLDTENRRVIIGDIAEAAIVAVDLDSGARTVLSSDAVGQGPSLSTIESVAVDRRTGRIVVANGYDDLLMAVDPDTGARTVISGGGVGIGPTLMGLQRMSLGAGDSRALVAASLGVLSVDLATGNRTLLGSGIEHVLWLHWDEACNQIMIASGRPGDHGLFALALDSGQLGRMSDYHACRDLPAGVIETPAYDVRIGRVMGWHDVISALMAVDVQTGACTTQATPVVSGGGPWPYPHRDMIVDPSTHLLLMADDAGKALMAMDPETGEHVIVSR